MSGHCGAMVKAQASDSQVGGCEFKPRHCHLTGYMMYPLPGLLMPPYTVDMSGQGLKLCVNYDN